MSDNDKIFFLQKQMHKVSQDLAGMSEPLASARQVKEYDGDRRKRLLAIAMKVFIELGDSAASADCKARASDSYGEGLIKLSGEYLSAMETVEKHDALKVQFASAQSLLAVEREKLSRI